MSRKKEIQNPHHLGVKLEFVVWAKLDTLAKSLGKTVSVYVREKLTEIADDADK